MNTKDVQVIIKKGVEETLNTLEKGQIERLVAKIQNVVDKSRDRRTEKECIICHQKFTPTTKFQKVCGNHHCKLVSKALTLKNKLMKLRNAELGIVEDEVIGG